MSTVAPKGFALAADAPALTWLAVGWESGAYLEVWAGWLGHAWGMDRRSR